MQGWSALPTMVKVGVIGGGVGLAVFLYNRQKAGGGGGSSSNAASFGLPNTAIMLGSLQQGQLDLKGQVGQSTADLSNQMASDTSQIQDNITGSNELLGQTLSMMSQSFQTSFGTLQDNLTGHMDSNTNNIINAIGASTSTLSGDINQRSDLLSQLIGGNDNALAAAMGAMSNSISKGFSSVQTQQNVEAAAIGALGSNVSANQLNIIGQLQQLGANDMGLQADIMQMFYSIPNRYTTTLSPGLDPSNPFPTSPTSGAFNWGSLNGSILFSTVDQAFYTVQNGKVLGASTSYAQANAGTNGPMNTGLSLKGVANGSAG
jgi:hypothetical protein